MAPEQLAGQPVDARTDQFAFCVALYEALHGERPPDELRGHSERPDRRRAGEAYPRWLWDVMVRGLAHAPDHRFASMDALLAELTRRRERARRRTIAISAAVCVLAIAGAMLTINPAAVPICPRVPDKLVGIWDAATKQRVHAALAGTGAPFADKVWAATAAAFDGYADRWLDAQQAACKATYVEHVQSADLLDRRTDCLEGRRRSFAATTEVLRDRPAQAVAHAGELVNSLAEIALCADASFLLELARHRPALPPGAQAQAAEIRVQLARARALMATEDLSGAEPVIARAAALARGPGDDPAHAEIDYLSAYVKMLRGSLPEALQLFDRAIEQAIAIRDDELAADVYLTLAMSAAERNLKPTEGRRWLQQAQAWLDRLGHASDPRAIQIKAARGYLQLADGDAGPAVVTLSSAIGDTEKRWGAQDPRLIVLLEGRASGHARIGERDAAVADGKRALELGLRTWGQDYPEVARTRRVLGMIYLEQFSDPQRGAAELTEALRIFRAQHDPESIEIANCEQGLSVAAQYRGDLAAVLEHAETAERIFAGRLGATNPRRAEALNGVAVARFLLRDYTGALAAYEAVYPIWSQAFGPGHPSVGLLLSNTGEALLALDRPSAAQRDFDQALAILKTALPADSPDLALPLKGLGLTRLRLGHPSEAIAPFEQALALRIRAGTIGEPAEVAEIQWGLARALRALGRDPVRAHKLALDALAGYRSLGAQLDWRAQEISQGLRSW
jgi:tetratricopeptide (TPR) repeat protein